MLLVAGPVTVKLGVALTVMAVDALLLLEQPPVTLAALAVTLTVYPPEGQVLPLIGWQVMFTVVAPGAAHNKSRAARHHQQNQRFATTSAASQAVPASNHSTPSCQCKLTCPAATQPTVAKLPRQ